MPELYTTKENSAVDGLCLAASDRCWLGGSQGAVWQSGYKYRDGNINNFGTNARIGEYE